MMDGKDYDVVQAGERIKAFVADPFITMALQAMEQEAYAKFKVAKTNDERLIAQAEGNAIGSFAFRLQQMVQEGQLAKND